MIRGYCVHIISGKAVEINETTKLEGKTWWEMRPYFIQMPASTWKELKVFIIKTCKKYGQCDKEVSSWERTVEIIDEQVKNP